MKPLLFPAFLDKLTTLVLAERWPLSPSSILHFPSPLLPAGERAPCPWCFPPCYLPDLTLAYSKTLLMAAIAPKSQRDQETKRPRAHAGLVGGREGGRPEGREGGKASVHTERLLPCVYSVQSTNNDYAGRPARQPTQSFPCWMDPWI